MALFEVFHVVATELPIDATNTTDIPQGVLVSLDDDGNVILANGDHATRWPLGMAGDTRSAGTSSYTAESGSALSRNPTSTLTGSLIIGANGGQQRFTQNRVSDNFNEVLASGKMTVYHSGGEFWTDQYEIVQSGGSTVASYTPGTALFASGSETAASADVVERTGRFTDEAGTVNTPGGLRVGYTLTSPTAYPSGVPGTDVASSSGLGGGEGGNSLSFGTFLHVKLAI